MLLERLGFGGTWVRGLDIFLCRISNCSFLVITLMSQLILPLQLILLTLVLTITTMTFYLSLLKREIWDAIKSIGPHLRVHHFDYSLKSERLDNAREFILNVFHMYCMSFRFVIEYQLSHILPKIASQSDHKAQLN